MAEFLLTVAIPLLWAVWELVALKRSYSGDTPPANRGGTRPGVPPASEP